MQAKFLIATLTGACAITCADDTFQPRDVFELEFATSPAIAPDGSAVVYQRVSADIMTDRFVSSLWMVDLDTLDHRPLLAGDGSYSSPIFSPSGDRLLYSTSTDGQPELRVLFMDTHQTMRIARLPAGAQNPAWSLDGASIVFGMFVEEEPVAPAALPKKPENAEWAPPVTIVDEIIYRNDGAGYAKPGASQVFVVPADGGTPRQITGLSDDDAARDLAGPLAWTPDGDLIVAMNPADDAEYDPQEQDLYRLDIQTGNYERLTTRNGVEGSPQLAPDGTTLAFSGFEDRMLGTHTSVLSIMDLQTRQTRDLTTDLDRSVGAFEFAPDAESIWFTYADHGVGILASISRSARITERARNVGGTTLGRPYASGAFAVGPEGLFTYTVTDPTRPGDLVIARAEGDQTTELYRTRLNEDLLAHKNLPSAQLLTAQSVGGLEIQGWLVLPPGHIPGDTHPMILEIHGGPFADYGPRFSAEIQLFASARYAVLYANPRGSTSYGAAFANEIHHNYPSQDYDDLIAITDAAIATGHIDPNRLFVTGGSGGGVLTAWIVGKTDRFQAAVVAKPVINWLSFVLTADAYTFFPAYWFSAMPWEDPMQYWNRSPLSLVGNVSTPTMLLAGEADYRTPMSESEQYYQALRLRKVATRLVRIPEASHGIAARPSHLLAKVAEILRWFEEHDPGGS